MPKGIPKTGINNGWFSKGRQNPTKGKTKRVNTCKGCGIEFTRYCEKHGMYQKVTYCTTECMKKHKIIYNKGLITIKEILCEQCNKPFKNGWKHSQGNR